MGLLAGVDSSYQSGLSRRTPKVSVSQAIYGNTDSHQYEPDESEVWRHHQLLRHFDDRGNWWTFAKKREVRRWWLTFITGVICGVVAIFVTVATRLITRAKYDLFHTLVEQEKAEIIPYGTALSALWLCNLCEKFLFHPSLNTFPHISSNIPSLVHSFCGSCLANGLLRTTCWRVWNTRNKVFLERTEYTTHRQGPHTHL